MRFSIMIFLWDQGYTTISDNNVSEMVASLKQFHLYTRNDLDQFQSSFVRWTQDVAIAYHDRDQLMDELEEREYQTEERNMQTQQAQQEVRILERRTALCLFDDEDLPDDDDADDENNNEDRDDDSNEDLDGYDDEDSDNDMSAQSVFVNDFPFMPFHDHPRMYPTNPDDTKNDDDAIQ
jgi:hypothetical protein